MPTYSYECEPCEWAEDDVFHKLAEAGPDCPYCKKPMKKKLAAPAFAVRGSNSANGYQSVPKDSIPVDDFQGGLMEAAREGAKAGGEKEGHRRVQQYQQKMETKYGGA